MIIIGIDDTDVAGSRGTNRLARHMASLLSEEWRCVWIVRHQLLFDPRVPYTSKNGSASLTFEPRDQRDQRDQRSDSRSLLDRCRQIMLDDFIDGSDPGLCLLDGDCPQAVVEWGRRCQREVVTKAAARALAAAAGLHLESLGGTEDGVIEALAAIGLASEVNDGRIVQLGEWPDDLSGPVTTSELLLRGVVVRHRDTETKVAGGIVDVGKRLRPNLRNGSATLFVEPGASLETCPPDSHTSELSYVAIKLP